MLFQLIQILFEVLRNLYLLYVIVGCYGFQKIVGQHINVPNFLVLGSIGGHNRLQWPVISVDYLDHLCQQLNHAKLIEDTLFLRVWIVTALCDHCVVTIVNESNQVFQNVNYVVQYRYIHVVFKLSS